MSTTIRKSYAYPCAWRDIQWDRQWEGCGCDGNENEQLIELRMGAVSEYRGHLFVEGRNGFNYDARLQGGLRSGEHR